MPSPGAPAEFATLRARYQEGLLAWLKNPEDRAGLTTMIAALEAVAACPGPACRMLAGAARELLRGIADGRIAPLLEYRRLAARVELELKRAFLDASLSPDNALLRALRAPFEPARQEEQGKGAANMATTEIGTVPEGTPLTGTLTAMASILPLFAAPRAPRFTTRQRRVWDAAVDALTLAWAAQGGKASADMDWQPLRRAAVKLLEGALALDHPAPLKLAEAFVSALDGMETTSPAPRRLTALAATVELVAEAGFLEHDALSERVAQLAHRLESTESGPRSETINALFAAEAADEIEDMRHALETVPPDIELLAGAAHRLRQLAEPLELTPLALAAFRFADTVARLDPALLDHAPGRDDALAWVDQMARWIDAIGAGTRPALPVELVLRHQALQTLRASAENARQPFRADGPTPSGTPPSPSP
ncbi:MAG: hypothetical protein LBO79_01155 [Zoogloeaceae bacterium]|jgi:hypothetical protein|nr:hypothetical protein [Zoogloeaceae bacterium]